MRSLKSAVPLALAVSAVAAVPATAAQKPSPKAQASGTDAVELTYPSIVQTRVGRTERALERATKRMENGQPADAAVTLKVVRRQMAAAWRGAKYVIRTTPAPPPPEDFASARAGRRPRRPRTPGRPTPRSACSPCSTTSPSSMVALIDGAHGTGLNALSTTINLANDRRDQALAYILSVSPPAPPDGGPRPGARQPGGGRRAADVRRRHAQPRAADRRRAPGHRGHQGRRDRPHRRRPPAPDRGRRPRSTTTKAFVNTQLAAGPRRGLSATTAASGRAIRAAARRPAQPCAINHPNTTLPLPPRACREAQRR